MPLPAYEVPNALNWTPVQEGFNALANSAYRQQQQGLEQQRFGLEQQQTQSQIASQKLQQQQEAARLHGGAAQAVLNAPPDQQAALGQEYLSAVPELKQHIINNGMDPANVPVWAKALRDEALGAQNPLDVESKRLANEKTRVDIEAGKIFSGQPGAPVWINQGGKWVQMGGGDAFSDYGPNGEPPGTWQGPAGAPNAAPQAPAQQPQQPSPNYAAGYAGGLPSAGAPTALASGAASPGMQNFAPYYSPEDVMRLRREERMSPRMATAAQNTPGSQERIAYAKKVGENQADLESTRKTLQPLFNLVDAFEKEAVQAGPGALANATGPVANDEYAQALRYETGTPARFFSGGYVDPYGQSYNLNVSMQHYKKAIATLFKAIPGSGKGGGTDQAQAELEGAIGEALKTTDPGKFFSILHAAKNTLRGLGSYGPLPDLPSYYPWDKTGKPIQGWGVSAAWQPGQAAPTNGQQPPAALPPGNYDYDPATGTLRAKQ